MRGTLTLDGGKRPPRPPYNLSAGLYFRGAPFQKGYGIGSVFSSLVKSIMPLIKSGAKAIGKQTRGVASLARSGGQSRKPGGQSFEGRLFQYFKS